jgi:hypothetical protein
VRYKNKVIESGDVIEVYQYENYVLTGKDKKSKASGGGSRAPMDEDERAKRDRMNEERASRRAKQNLRRLINANIGKYGETSKFLTLTFKENVQDLEYANEEFNKFIKRLNYKLTGSKKSFLKYVCVVEFQGRGAVHYHVIFFNMPYVPVNEVAEVWGHGFVKLNKIDEVDNVGAYVVKYMGKDFDPDDDPGSGGKKRRDKGKKRYFASRGLIKPKERVVNEKELNELGARLAPAKVFESEFENDHLGVIRYTQYNMKRLNV